MTNLIITRRCNLNCDFCFAAEHKNADFSGSMSDMSRADFHKLLDFSASETARFCGGEPSLHKDFIGLIKDALARRHGRAFIMSNGLWPQQVLQDFAALKKSQRRRIEILLNVLPHGYSAAQLKRLEQSLDLFNPRQVTVGFTIDRVDYDAQPVLDLAERFKVKRLRFSIAAPTVTIPASWQLDPERDFKKLATRVYELAIAGRARGLQLHSDCGYLPPCVFTDEQRALLMPDDQEQEAMPFHCNGPLDVSADDEAWRCYGLYSVLRAKPSDYANAAELSAYFARQSAGLDRYPLLAACADCDWKKRGLCGGGCYAHRLVVDLKKRAHDDGINIEDDRSMSSLTATINTRRLRRFAAQATGAKRAVWMYLDDEEEWTSLQTNAAEAQVLNCCANTEGLKNCPKNLHTSLIAMALRRFYQMGLLKLTN